MSLAPCLVCSYVHRCSVEALDQILAVRHVDAALIGPNDLSIALGGMNEISMHR